MCRGFLWGDLREGEYLEHLGIDGRQYYNGSSRNGMERHEVDCPGSGLGQVVGVCESGNELSGSIKCRECLE